MKPRAFDYARAESLSEVFALFREYGDEARIIAGGQSLVPAMAMRLASPALLIDINRVEELRGIRRDGAVLRIGALTTYRELGESPLVAECAPLIAQALPHVAHPAIRSRGTLGGSLANADPAAEMPACMLALDATLVIAGSEGRRQVRAEDFFKGVYETALDVGEVLAEIAIPVADADRRFAFDEIVRRRGDYATIGLAAAMRDGGAPFQDLRLAFFGVADRPILALRAARGVQGGDAETGLDEDCTPLADLHCSAAMKSHLARVLLKRVLARLTAQEG